MDACLKKGLDRMIETKMIETVPALQLALQSSLLKPELVQHIYGHVPHFQHKWNHTCYCHHQWWTALLTWNKNKYYNLLRIAYTYNINVKKHRREKKHSCLRKSMAKILHGREILPYQLPIGPTKDIFDVKKN